MRRPTAYRWQSKGELRWRFVDHAAALIVVYGMSGSDDRRVVVKVPGPGNAWYSGTAAATSDVRATAAGRKMAEALLFARTAQALLPDVRNLHPAIKTLRELRATILPDQLNEQDLRGGNKYRTRLRAAHKEVRNAD